MENRDLIAVSDELTKVFDGFSGKCPNCEFPLQKSVTITCEREASGKNWLRRIVGKLVCSNSDCHFDEVVVDKMEFRGDPNFYS